MKNIFNAVVMVDEANTVNVSTVESSLYDTYNSEQTDIMTSLPQTNSAQWSPHPQLRMTCRPHPLLSSVLFYVIDRYFQRLPLAAH